MSEISLVAATDIHQTEKFPKLLVLVAKYRDLGVDSAAQLHHVASQIAPHLRLNSDAVSGSVVLSTCNRFEIYCEAAPNADVETAYSDTLTAVSYCSGLPLVRLIPLFECLWGSSVAEHLFSVGTGLQSIVAGEREIAGQVRRALCNAQQAGTVSGLLVRLFETASKTAKEVGARTTLSRSSRSIAAVALDLAAKGPLLPPLTGASVVLFGTGAYASCVLNILRSRGCSDISVFSRSGRAEAFVAARGATALTAGDLASAVATSDLLIGCSGIGTRFDSSELECGERPVSHPLTVVDLVPSHDFELSVAELPCVELINLESVRRDAPKADAEVLSSARHLVQQAAQHFEERERSRVADLAIVALRQHVHKILDTEMQRVMQQYSSAATAEEVNAALRRIARQFLHVPTVRAAQLAVVGRQDEYRKALEVLFGISVTHSNPEKDDGDNRPELAPLVPGECGLEGGPCPKADRSPFNVCPRLCMIGTRERANEPPY
ncbi:glutamyl-tRNA reductase [Arthrobacter sp. TMN-50]